MIKIPKEVQYVTDTITKNGKTPHDFDVAASALPDTVEKMFENTIPTGKKHGTVTVIIDDTPIEVTTFRTESGYNDSRRPDEVRFISSLKEDLSRRDFTVNAIAYDKSRGIIDYFGGVKDIENKILRAVGDPERRFCEDALRILRLFRFASVLNFECESDTLNAALKCSGDLKKISGERIFSEIYKAASGENFKVFEKLIAAGALEFSEIRITPDFDLIKKAGASKLSFFAFIYYSSSDMLKTLTRLKVSNKLKNYCLSLEKLLKNDLPTDKPQIKTLLCDYPPDILSDFLKLKGISEKTDACKAQKLLDEIIERGEPYRISDLKINGADLKNLGISGKKIGETLKKLQAAVINDPSQNDKANLMSKILP